ncbi:MAG TPA: ABC transporter permease [Bosea sp. (in: a-proteobacteria)]|jgi:peptide/nickel transport system permease protein|nr:ABC transporter permease [Bosea sp. (in: a-proteobacteria)]
MSALRRSDWLLLAITALFALTIAYGLTLDPIDASLRNSLRAPGLDFPFGTDHLGRDVLARIAHGFLRDVGLSLTIIALSFATGIAMGMLAAELAGAVDRALTFVMDLLTSLPQIVIALILAANLGGGELALILALSLTGWVQYARIARATVFSLRERGFVTSARLAGGSRLYVLRRHILPHLLPLLSGLVALQFGHNILNIAALGFLGIGVQPPAPEWGAMIAEARPYFSRAPWLAIVPGLYLFAMTMVALMLTRRSSFRQELTTADPQPGPATP